MSNGRLRAGAAALTRKLEPHARRLAGESEKAAAIDLDDWLKPCFGAELDPVEARLTTDPDLPLSVFSGLSDDLWALLSTRSYSAYPAILKALPEVPDPALQISWNGAEGVTLAAQSASFYSKVKARIRRYGEIPVEEASLLDFGCGWGRLLRLFGREVTPDRLFGCDPVESILDTCREAGVRATLARSEFLPREIPFEEKFDAAYSFSVFTHISEESHLTCLNAIHGSLKPGGLFFVTVRPPGYLRISAESAPLLEQAGPDLAKAYEGPRYGFQPHASDESHPQFDGTKMHYGEAVIGLDYIREKWDMFELLDVTPQASDMYQVVVTLRRKD
ncbi:MAG: class I SAM-dependent methyltransferase [Solirubrobacterales bacterium]|nr:class I SAM-dependent methyltransferase [Solirubrobacterales bacterium]HMT04279.1 class I SAM-dependent methyltransferase [Solirubrobacterales bacterium]